MKLFGFDTAVNEEEEQVRKAAVAKARRIAAQPASKIYNDAASKYRGVNGAHNTGTISLSIAAMGRKANLTRMAKGQKVQF